jgi:hypothetical protein
MAAIEIVGVTDTPFLFPDMDPDPVLEVTPPAGLLDDFAYSERTLPDAAITEIRGWEDFASNVAWERPYVSASRPRTNYFSRAEGSDSDQVFWRQADFAEVSLTVEDVDTSRSHYLDSVQFEEDEVHTNLLGPWATHFEGQWEAYVGAEDGSTSFENYNSDSAQWAFHRNGRWAGWFRWATNFAGPLRWHPVRVTGMAQAEEGQSLVGSMWVLNTSSYDTFSVRATLVYYDEDFAYVNKDVGTYVSRPHNSDKGYVEISVYGYPPAGTAWVACLPEVDGTTLDPGNGGMFVDEISIRNISMDPLPYEDPRKQVITVVATRVNEICDPQPTNTALMYGSWGDTIGAADGINPIDGVTGGFVITSTASNDYVTITNSEPYPWSPDKQLMAGLQPGIPYVLSVWVRKIMDVDIKIDLYAPLGEGIYSTASPTYNELMATGDPSDETTFRKDASNRQWVRLQVPFVLGPTGEFNADVPVPIFEINSVWDGVTSPLPAGDVFEAIAFQVERGSVATEYFDGSLGPDYLWEGTAHISRSHYYEGYLTGSNRIDDVVAEYIPFGVPFEVQYAQPDTGPRELLDAYGRPLGDTFG